MKTETEIMDVLDQMIFDESDPATTEEQAQMLRDIAMNLDTAADDLYDEIKIENEV